jgi:hypothetical protein
MRYGQPAAGTGYGLRRPTGDPGPEMLLSSAMLAYDQAPGAEAECVLEGAVACCARSYPSATAQRLRNCNS